MRFPALAVLALALATLAAVSSTAQTAPWDYQGKRGELVWGKLDPEYKNCAKGHEQSPIDIRGARLNKALLPIQFHYIASAVTVENNGHTIEVLVKSGSYIVAGGVRYELVQFHFHHPSEETVSGKRSDISIHLVHKSTDGKLAVLAVRMHENMDAPNAVLAQLWPHMPKAAGASEKVTEMVNPGGLLPADQGYWTYIGSLTTPPCTEGVRWFVFEQELTLSRDQLRAFTALYKMNARAMQDAHGRRIEANE